MALRVLSILLALFFLSVSDAWADPPLEVSQTIPTAFQNDAAGQTYQAIITNPAGTIDVNLTQVSLDIPDSGFFYVGGTLTADDGGSVSVTVSGTDPVLIDFPAGYTLSAGGGVTITYDLSTNFEASEGDFPLTVTATYDGAEADQDDGLITVAGCQAELEVSPISPAPYEVAVGDTIVVEARVQNTGPGPVFDVDLSADWGAGFGNPALEAGGTVTPTRTDSAYETTIPEIPAGEERFFRYRLEVIGCEDLTTKGVLVDPCDPDVTFTEDASPLLRVEQPNLSLIVSDIAIPYCDSETVEVRVRNDNSTGDRGPARNVEIETDIPNDLAVDNVADGWDFDAGNRRFTYTANGEEIPPGTNFPGDDVVLTFDLTPVFSGTADEDFCSSRSGTIRFFPDYENNCGKPFAAVPTFAGYSIDAAPELSLEKTASGTESDGGRVFLGEEVTFTVTPTLTEPTEWAGTLSVSDSVPAAFSVTDATATDGTVNRSGNDISWELTPGEAAGGPVLTITATASTDGCDAGQFWDNTATITGTTDCAGAPGGGCSETASATAGLYLQSQAAGGVDEAKQVTETGPFNVCDPGTTIPYEITYTFTSGSWSGSTYTDFLDGDQAYVANSAEFELNGGDFSSVPTGNVSAGPPFTIDLGFLGAGPDSNDTLTLRYETTLSPSSLPACQATGTILSRSTLFVNGAGGGCGGNGEFQQAVEVPVTRTQMAIDISLEDSAGNSLSTVSKGQPVRAVVDVSHLTGTPANEVTITVDTDNYAWLGNPTYTGFGGERPDPLEPTPAGGQVVFTFPNAVEAGGTIAFDAVKTCQEYDISATLEYCGACNFTGGTCSSVCTDSATAEPQIQLEGDLILDLTPDQFQVTSDTLSWTIFVTNGGSGTAYDVRLTDQLKDNFDYVSSTVDGAPATPTVTPSATSGYNDVVWSLDNMAPNEVRKVEIEVRTTIADCDFSVSDPECCDFEDANTVIAQYGWADENDDYTACETETAPSAPVVTEVPSRLVLRNEVDPVALCGTGTIRLTVTNTGQTVNYNIDLTQSLGSTGFIYQTGTAEIVRENGAPLGVPVSINDPLESGTDLQWTFGDAESNYLPRLASMNPGESFTIAFDVASSEAFNNNRLIESEAAWEQPCERGIQELLNADPENTTAGAGFVTPIRRPNITMRKDGRNVTEGDSVFTNAIFGEPGDTLEWRIRIENNGDVAADNVELTDTLPTNVTFDSISRDTTNFSDTPELSGSSPTWTLNSSIPAGSTAGYLLRATVNTDGCGADLNNTAEVSWACTPSAEPEDRIVSPSRNSDTSILATQPSVTVADISQTITDFTTTGGTVTITLEIAGAPMYNVTLEDDLTARFEVAGPISYSDDLPTPEASPGAGTSGNAPLTWEWTSNPISPGTHTISFPIQNATDACDDGSELLSALTLTYEDACGNGLGPVENTDQRFDPGLADLTVTKTETVQVTTTGSAVTWTIAVENTGDGTAENVTVEDVLGDGFAFQSAARTVPSAASPDSAPAVNGSGSIVWNNQAIPAGETFEYEITANFLAAGSHLNDVTATATGNGGCLVDEESDQAAVAGFAFSKALDQAKSPAYDNIGDAPGEVVTYTITADFQGEDDYQNIEIQDTLPEGVVFEAVQSETGPGTPTAFSQSGKDLAWTLSNFSGSGTVEIVYTARILREGAAQRGSDLENTARADFEIDFGDGTVFEFFGNPPDSLDALQASTTFPMREPLLTLGRTANPADGESVVAGQTISHTLTVTNGTTNTAPAYETRVTDVLPEGARDFDPTTSTIEVAKDDGTALVENTDFIVAYNQGTGTLTFDFLDTENATLLPGESFEITYQSQVDGDIAAGVELEHDADVPTYASQPTGTADRQTYDNVDNQTVTHNTTASDYTKTLVSPAGPLAPGMEAQFEIQFTVPANTSVYDIHVVDTLPAGMEYVNGSSTGPGAGVPALTDLGDPEPDVSGQTVTWFAATDDEDIINNTGNDVTYTITYSVVVRADAGLGAGASLDNAFSFNYNTADNDPNSVTSNDPFSETVSVALPALTLSKTIVPDTAEAGDEVTITLNVENPAGPNRSTAYAVTVTDLLNDNQPDPDGNGEVYGNDTIVYDCAEVSEGTTPGGWSFDSVDAGDVPGDEDCRVTFEPDGGGDLAAGATASFTFTATLADTAATDATYPNTGRASGHSIPSGSARFGDPAYDAQPQAFGTDDVVTPAPTATGKVLVDSSADHTAGNDVAVGEILTYELRFQFPAGTTRDVVVADFFPDPPANPNPGELEFIGNATLSSDPAGALTSDVPDGAVTMDDTVDGEFRLALGDVLNSSGDPAEYVLRLAFRVANDPANQDEEDGVFIENRGRINWTDGDGNDSQAETNSVTVAVVEPNLELGKTLGPDTNPDPQPGGTVQWRVFITNNGNATAFQVNFEEILPDGLFDIRNVTVTNEDGDVFRNNTTIPLDEDDATVSTTTNPNDTLTLSPFQIAGGGARTTIVFDCTVESDVTPGEEITNVVRAAYTSLPDGGRDNSTNPGNVDDDDDSDLNNYEESTERTLNAATGAVGDTVWLDDNDNGVRDAGESGIPNVRVDLLDPDSNVIDSVVTDADGRYSFTGIPAGNYGAQVDAGTLPPGLTQTAAPPDSFTVPADGAFLDADFGYQNTSTTTALAGDRVWHDADGDGVQDPGEPGIGGVTLDLLSAGPDGVFATGDDVREDSDTTGPDGGYLFPDIPPGEYIVAVTDTANVLNGYTLTGGTDPSAPFTLAGGDIYRNADFGYQNPALFSISDRVWLDANGDGTPDPGESGLSGVTVSLRDAATGAVIATTPSGADGRFTFPGLPDGDYIVSVTDTANRLAGLFPTTANACCGNLPVTVAAADETGENFGYNRAGLIGDTVWNDANGNSVQDPGESGIEDVTVELRTPGDDGTFGTADDPTPETAITDSSGFYQFENRPEGSYRVVVTDTDDVLDDFTLTTQNQVDPQIDRTLAAGESILDADFGYQNPNLFSITNRVWIDSDSDGTQNGGESGAPDVTVTLLDDGGTPIASATTDGSGDFTFPGLAPGDYTLQITDLAGRLNGFTETTDAGQNGTLGVTVVDADLSAVDFGYVQSVVTGTIGDLVWRDENGNGVPDGTESGIGGATVFLDADGDGVLDSGETSTDTADDGSYRFDNLPAGLYTVAVDESSLPAGLALTTANEPLTVALSAGEDFPDADFGYQEQGEVFGHLFIDTNGDGTQQADEPDLSGVDVVITDSLNNDIRLTSDADGNYSVSVPTGTATVDVDETTLPAGYLQTAGTDPDTVTVPAGGSVNAGDDGYQPRGTIEGHLFIDENGDGVQNAGEPNLSGIDVIITDAAGDTQTVTTDDNGDWSADVSAGEATADVDETTLPPGYVQTAGTDPSSADVPSGGTADAGDDGYQRRNGVIRDFVWNDRNGDGLQDPDEPGLEGVVVYLDLDGNGARDATDPSAVTDADGRYAIGSLSQGNYTVRVDEETIPQGFVQTGGADPLSVTLAEAEDFPDADFGYQRRDGLIGDLVWEDRNGNGVRDPGEPGISDVTVFLDANGNGIPDPGESATVTGADGGYAFSGLIEGEYTVAVDDATLPAGLGLSGGSDPLPVSLAAGQEFRDADFGYSRAAGAIGDRVWIDLNGNSVDDPGEPGIPNATVRLLDETGARIDQIPTDADGRYRFSDLPQGIYTVDVLDDTIPAGLTTTDDPSPAISLSAGEFFDEADFGYTSETGVIGDTIWRDANGDGVQNPGESGIGGVTVALTAAGPDGLLDTADDVSAGTATTAADGSYAFSGLDAGRYRVAVTDTAGILANATLTGGTDPTAPIDLAAGQAFLNADFGYQIPDRFTLTDRLWRDDNANGAQDGGEPGFAGVTVTLVDAGGRGIATDISDAAGDVQFPGLPDGDYTLLVTDTAGVLDDFADTTPPATAGFLDATIAAADVSGINFGYNRPGAVGDTVFSDADGDGLQGPGEPGIVGVTLALVDPGADDVPGTADDVRIAAAETGPDGGYLFPGLAADRYGVVVTDDGNVLDGFTLTSDNAPFGPFDLAAGASRLDADFGYQRGDLPDVSGTIWNDLDAGATREPGEPLFPDVTVRLVDAQERTVAETNTGPDGSFRFSDVPPGDYTVTVTDLGSVLEGFGRTTPAAEYPITVLDADIPGLDFGYVRNPDRGSIGDRVWRDDNGDGIQNDGEPGVSGVTVILLDENTGAERARTVTDSEGKYRFEELPAGDYRVRFVRPDGVAFSPAGVGTDPAADSDADPATGDATTSLLAGQERSDLDAGLIPAVSSLTIGDLVWVDANANGLPDPGEGRAGVRLTLQGADGNVVAETVTSADGTYAFTDLPPGDYRVLVDRDTLPADVDPLSDPDGGLDDLADVVNLTADRLDVDFGYRPRGGGDPSPPPVDRTARLGDFVWEDLNENGVQDPGEPGVSGVVVRLFNSGGTVFLAQTTTDADGRYRFFGLTPGSYQVAFEAPNGFSFTNPGQGNAARDSNPDPATGRAGASVSAGAAVLDIDAGLIRGPEIALGDLVWRDANGNGIPDPGEGLPGIRLILTDGTGAAVAETVTDGTGGYRFAGLPPGDYQIQVDPASLPADLVLLADPEGAIDGVAVLPNQNADNLNVDFGYRPVGPMPDLSGALKIAADINGGDLLPGDDIAYTVTLRNEGEGPAREVVYVDTPDPFTRLVPGSVTTTRGAVTLGNGSGDFSIRVEIGTVEPGESVRVSYRVTVAADAAPGSWIVNQGMVMASGQSVEPTEWPVTAPQNDPTLIGPIPGGPSAPPVALAKSATDRNGAPLQPGDEVEYGLTLRNAGPETASGLLLFDGPPAGTTLVAGSATADRGTVVEGNPIEWIIGELGPGEVFTGRFRVTVNANLAEGGLICNRAVLLGDGGLRVESQGPDGDDTCRPVAPADGAMPVVRAVKRGLDLDGGSLSPGDRVGYRVTLVNPADGPAEGVVFADPMTGRVALIPGSVTAERGMVERGNGPGHTDVRVSVGTLAPGERIDIAFEGRISPDAMDGEIISNQGQVEWTGGNAPTDDPATTTPDDPTDVVVVQPEGERIPPRGFKLVRGDWPLVSWTLRYENDDDRPMVLHVEDPIPEGARLVADSVTATFGTTGVLADPERVVWDGEVPAGGAVEIGYRVRVDDGVFRLDNQACAIWDRDGDRLWTDEPDAGTGWICTDDPTTPALGDPTAWTTGCELSLGDRVWIDTDADGVCRFVEERRPDGVRLSLYRDADGDNHFSPGVDPLLETTVADARNGVPGLYRFEDLCPGDYIVGVDAANFGPGGALEGMRPTHFGGDPDNDRDDDSNAEIVPDVGIFSPAVTLEPRTEPDFEDGDPMSNLTVDFGFVPPPPAPEECPACGPFKPF